MIPYFRAVLIDDNEKRGSTLTSIHLIVNQITDYCRLFSILLINERLLIVADVKNG